MKLYTKQGDDGSTGLFGGARVGKDHPRVCAYGEVDELNSALGWASAAVSDAATLESLRRIQSDLFVIGGELANPQGQGRAAVVGAEEICRVEQWIDACSDAVAPLRSFILPGGCEAAARWHVARGVCRRAERSVVALSHAEAVRGELLIYLNRLGDLLFALGRLANHQAGVADIPWHAPSA